MTSDENLLLKTILEDLREVRTDVKDLKANQVPVSEFNVLKTAVLNQGSRIDSHRKVINGGTWLARAAFLVTGAPGHKLSGGAKYLTFFSARSSEG